jgi:hypothetical protein
LNKGEQYTSITENIAAYDLRLNALDCLRKIVRKKLLLLVLVQDFILYHGQWMIYSYKGSTEIDIATVCFGGSPTENGTASHYMLGLAERVAQSGEVLNVAECLEVEKGSGCNIKSLLAMPIRNRHYQIIGKFIDTCLSLS